MTAVRLRLILVVLLYGGGSAAAIAQEMRVYTTVRDISAQGSKESGDRAPTVSRSLTLFHAGKVYDYIDSAREVTIYEPIHRRFTLLSERRQMVAEVAQEEVRQFLTLAKEEVWKRLEAAEEQAGSSQVRSLAWTKFQLQPEFSVSFDKAKSSLSLNSRNCRYAVEAVEPPSRDVVETYLRFADSMAELNSVLHPSAMLPAARLKLNEELRQRQLLPVSVEIRADLDRPLWKQARHEWTWKFQSTDRQLISNWEKQLSDPNLRRMTFRQYQQESLSGEIAKKR
jgi:hypothetical protein